MAPCEFSEIPQNQEVNVESFPALYSAVPAPESAANRRSALLSESSPAVLSSALQHPFWGDVSSFSRCEAAFLKPKPNLTRLGVHHGRSGTLFKS